MSSPVQPEPQEPTQLPQSPVYGTYEQNADAIQRAMRTAPPPDTTTGPPADGSTPADSPQATSTKDGLLAAIGKGALHLVEHPVQTVQDVGRGVFDAGIDATKTIASLGTTAADALGIHGGDRNATPITGPLANIRDSLFGPASSNPADQFAEGTAQFATGFWGAGKLLKGVGLAAETLAGHAALGVAKGAITDFAAIDPHKEQFGELVSQFGLTDLGALMTPGVDDGPVAARAKRALGGLIPGIAAEGLVASARLFRSTSILKSSTATVAEKSAAHADVQEQTTLLQNIADGTHIPDDPAIVQQAPNGKWQVVPHPKAVATANAAADGTLQKAVIDDAGTVHPAPADAPDLSHAEIMADAQRTKNAPFDNFTPAQRGFIDANGKFVGAEDIGNALSPPEFDNRWEAERQAASVNEAIANRFQARGPVTADQMSDVFSRAKEIEAANPEGVVYDPDHDHFNFTYMDPPEKVASLLQSMGRVLSPAFEQARATGGIGWEESVERARQMAGMIPREDMEDYLRTTSTILKNSDALVHLTDERVSTLGSQVAKWSEILDQNPQDMVAKQEALKALTAYRDLTADVAGANSGLGRGLNTLKNRGALTDVAFKGEPGAITPPEPHAPMSPDALANMDPESLAATARMFRFSNRPDVLLPALAKVQQPGSKFLQVFYAGVTSNPSTWFGVFSSIGATSLFEDGVRGLAGIATGNTEMIRGASDMLAGRLIYGKQTLAGMVGALKSGTGIIDPRPNYVTIPGIGGQVVKSMSARPLSAVEEFWKVNNNLSYVRMQSLALARRDATAQGLTGNALQTFLENRVQQDVTASIDPTTGATLRPDAQKFARLPSFTTPLADGDFGKSLQDLIHDHPFLTPLLPFVRVSANLTDYAFNKMTPIGMLSQQFKDVMAKGGPDAAIAGTRMAVGTTLWGTAGLMAYGGLTTGRGPTDPKLRDNWLQTHQPYSVKTPAGWVSYRRFEPFATPLGFAADIASILHDHGNDPNIANDGGRLMWAVTASTANAIVNKTYLSGLVKFMDAVGSGDGNKMRAFGDGLLTSPIPAGLGALNSDPYLRDTKGMFDAFVNKVPGWSTSLPAKYNWAGEPILAHRQQHSLNPFQFKGDIGPQAEDDVAQMNRALTPPPTVERFGNVAVNLNDRRFQNTDPKNTDTPYERMMALTRQLDLRGKVNTLLQKDRFKALPNNDVLGTGGQKWDLLNSLVMTVQHAARDKMLKEYPTLNQQLVGLATLKSAKAPPNDASNSILQQIGH